MRNKIYISMIVCIVVIVSLMLLSCGLFNTTTTYSGTGGSIISGINSFTIDISDKGAVYRILEVTLTNLNYANASDLMIRVEKVGDKRVTLVDQRGGTNAYAGTYVFVDDSNESGLSRLVTYSGVVVPETYQSEGDFNSFVDVETFGTWQLTILDWTAGTDGTLGSWSIKIEASGL
ncbi:MAG: hypothetical protein JSV25_05400 [Spirochaetota bacterium]|nr:MAG: hypothetical protein JSV25_05400 [Spirochaetota bacterium]